jgi:hypothetical protein
MRQFPVFGPDQGIFLRLQRAANRPDQENNLIFNAFISFSAALQANKAETKQGIDLLRTGTSDDGCTTKQEVDVFWQPSSLRGSSINLTDAPPFRTLNN